MKKIVCLWVLSAGLLTIATAQDKYKEISLPALMQKYRQHPSDMVIVDVRTDGEFHDTLSRYIHSDIGRIKGAVHIELRELQQNPESLKQLEKYKDKEIYLICSHSYRSRSASNILLKNGFEHVNNVQGGMTEWFRRYKEMAPYREQYETSVPYKNISPAQLYEQLHSKEKFLLVGINVTPRNFYDSTVKAFLQLAPEFKKAVFFNAADSLKIWELVKKEKGRPVVLFNNYSYGAAEVADWLAKKGARHLSYLVGGVTYFHEYLADNNLINDAASFLKTNSSIRFISPSYYCRQTEKYPGAQIIDLRHDTLFNKMNSGMRDAYTHLKGSVNFNAEKGVAAFQQAFPDKKLTYTMIPRFGMDGLELAGELAKMGYKLNWLIGGIQRFDWYSANMETFSCGDVLVRSPESIAGSR